MWLNVNRTPDSWWTWWCNASTSTLETQNQGKM